MHCARVVPGDSEVVMVARYEATNSFQPRTASVSAPDFRHCT